jgi:hypothetical protein
MKVRTVVRGVVSIVAVAALFASTGCAPKIARPEQLTLPMPIQGAEGEYLCSLTKDKTLAEWSDKMANVGLATSIGKTAGAIAGQQLLKQVPFVGGILGDWAGEKIGQKIAIESAGGMDFIKKTTELSFNSPEDLALYLYITYYDGEHYSEAIKAEMSLYPEFKKKYVQALVNASAQICQSGACQTVSETICKKGPCQ